MAMLFAILVGGCGGPLVGPTFEIEVENRSGMPAEVSLQNMEDGAPLSDSIRVDAGDTQTVRFPVPGAAWWGLHIRLPHDGSTLDGPELIEAQQQWQRGALKSAPRAVIEPSGEIHGEP